MDIIKKYGLKLGTKTFTEADNLEYLQLFAPYYHKQIIQDKQLNEEEFKSYHEILSRLQDTFTTQSLRNKQASKMGMTIRQAYYLKQSTDAERMGIPLEKEYHELLAKYTSKPRRTTPEEEKRMDHIRKVTNGFDHGA